MKRVVLIGGGEIGRKGSYETEKIDKKIVSLAKKEKPILLFIGLANSHSDSYYDQIKKNFKNLNCETMYLKRKNIINNPNIVEEKFNKADIIYIGGGDAIKLIEDIKYYKLDTKIKKAYERGCILVGISAGAILLSKEGFSDSYILRNEDTKHKFIKGLNIVDIIYCPHFENNSIKEKELIEDLKKKKKFVYALEDNTAIIITNKTIKTVKNNNKKIYICSIKDGIYSKEEI